MEHKYGQQAIIIFRILLLSCLIVPAMELANAWSRHSPYQPGRRIKFTTDIVPDGMCDIATPSDTRVLCAFVSINQKTYPNDGPQKLRLSVNLAPELSQHCQLVGSYPLYQIGSPRTGKWEIVENATRFKNTERGDSQYVNVDIPDRDGDYRLVIVLAAVSKEARMELARKLVAVTRGITVITDSN
jgi:hypothetical protein